MAKNIIQYDLLISCPGDIQSEISIIKEVVEQFNNLYSDTLGITIRTRHWLKSSYAQSGDKPQEILNNQLVRDCDAAIAIFWTRFGTPTDKYGSGSEEEIEIMLKSGKQVFMYFSEKPIKPSDITLGQYDKVIAFKQRYDKGLYFCYSDDADFGKLFFAHLSQYFLSLSKVMELTTQNRAQLHIKSIHNGELCNSAFIEKFNLNTTKNSLAMVKQIRLLFASISDNKLHKHPFSGGALIGAFYKPVEISEDTQKYIKSIAGCLKIELANDFFCLGNLYENTLANASIIGVGPTFNGTSEEKQKYHDIISLKKSIRDFISWSPIENCFDNLSCIKFVLSNEGTAFDEDIDIELEFATEMLVLHQKLPVPEVNSLEYACNDCSLSEIFEINGTALYMDYYSSRKTLSHPIPAPVHTSFKERDYEEDYRKTMDAIFDYQCYLKGEFTTIKLHVDYIKQHTSVAFPTPIFVIDRSSTIKYKITSRHNPDVVSRKIDVIARLPEQ